MLRAGVARPVKWSIERSKRRSDIAPTKCESASYNNRYAYFPSELGPTNGSITGSATIYATGSGSGSAAGSMVTAAWTTDYDSLTGTDESRGFSH